MTPTPTTLGVPGRTRRRELRDMKTKPRFNASPRMQKALFQSLDDTSDDDSDMDRRTARASSMLASMLVDEPDAEKENWPYYRRRRGTLTVLTGAGGNKLHEHVLRPQYGPIHRRRRSLGSLDPLERRSPLAVRLAVASNRICSPERHRVTAESPVRRHSSSVVRTAPSIPSLDDDADMSSCSTVSMTSPWNSPTFAGSAGPMQSGHHARSPGLQGCPPTPNKHHRPFSLTPSRQEVLGRHQLLCDLSDWKELEPVDAPSINDFDLLGLLGAGVSATVLRARARNNQHMYALKKSKHQLRSERERGLLLQEITVLEKLVADARNFDHIVRYYQAWQEEGYLYLQTELCEGGNLQDFLHDHMHRQVAIPEQCLWHIIHDTARGLDVLHRHDIVHLDVKPANVFISASSRLKIGDFGLASDVLSNPAANSMSDLEGDAMYMAKELLACNQRLPSADIFCLGITILELATQAPLPASGEAWHDLRDGRLPRLESEYSSDLEQLIQLMMHPVSASRPSAEQILSHPRALAIAAPSSTIVEYVKREQSSLAEEQQRLAQMSMMSPRTPRQIKLSFSWE